jgi:mannose-6-phosphate isomerase-like protein (cupin superfamily)
MGDQEDRLDLEAEIYDDAIMVPAGTWHNLTNTGDMSRVIVHPRLFSGGD